MRRLPHLSISELDQLIDEYTLHHDETYFIYQRWRKGYLVEGEELLQLNVTREPVYRSWIQTRKRIGYAERIVKKRKHYYVLGFDRFTKKEKEWRVKEPCMLLEDRLFLGGGYTITVQPKPDCAWCKNSCKRSEPCAFYTYKRRDG